MNQIYLVIENNGESYEDYHEWPVAAFDNEDKAKEYVDNNNQVYNSLQEIAKVELNLYDKEMESLENAIPFDYLDNQEEYYKIYEDIEEYVTNKYPNASSADYTHHSFRVSLPIPFNPS